MENMNGKFFMSDVYGGIWGTTEQTIPESADKQALVDDDNQSAAQTEDSTTKMVPFFWRLRLSLFWPWSWEV